MADENRLTEIEAKLAHQELAITELSDVIYRQQQQIDTLQQRGERLLQRCKELETLLDGDSPEDAPPPHY